MKLVVEETILKAWPHKIEYYGHCTWDDIKDINYWLEINRIKYNINFNYDSITWYLKSSEDAALFVLRWS